MMLSRRTKNYSMGSSRSVRLWLLVMVVLVAAMIVLGGATRLTNSGLSITEWRPITGALPPLSHAQWMSEFEKYKQIPEFAAEHPDMDLKGFEFIYFMEWSHRQLGRLIGLAYALPFFYFFFRKRLPFGHAKRFFAILLLIGVQGGIGWWMVASGLVNDRVDVSQYRLATHLGMAFIILGALYWLYRDQKENWPRRLHGVVLIKRTGLLALLVFIQIIAGAFVAGTHSGKSYNTWPLMDGDFIPTGYGVMSPFWKNLFENTAAIQFNHRTLAYIILAIAIWVFVSSRLINPRVGRVMSVFLVLLLVQILLGIWTLLMVAPLSLSLIHQFTSIFVFLVAIHVARLTRINQS